MDQKSVASTPKTVDASLGRLFQMIVPYKAEGLEWYVEGECLYVSVLCPRGRTGGLQTWTA